MLPVYQEDWVHAMPKAARPGDRINWTFRPHVDAIDQGGQTCLRLNLFD